MTTHPLPADNPYVGPRPFEEADALAGRYYGREREARDLLALVARERLVLFYAQSGAGKSSLLRASLIPGLRDLGFDALPIARLSGAGPGAAGPRNNHDVLGGIVQSAALLPFFYGEGLFDQRGNALFLLRQHGPARGEGGTNSTGALAAAESVLCRHT